MTPHTQTTADPATTPTHDPSVEEFLQTFAEAWKTNDGAIVGSFFTDDGSLINPFGQRADGQPAVAGMYSEYFGGMLQGTSTTFKPARVRAVESDHAFIDTQQIIVAATGETVLVVNLTALLHRHNGSWRFADARPYTCAVIPS